MASQGFPPDWKPPDAPDDPWIQLRVAAQLVNDLPGGAVPITAQAVRRWITNGETLGRRDRRAIPEDDVLTAPDGRRPKWFVRRSAVEVAAGAPAPPALPPLREGSGQPSELNDQAVVTHQEPSRGDLVQILIDELRQQVKDLSGERDRLLEANHRLRILLADTQRGHKEMLDGHSKISDALTTYIDPR